MIQRQTKSQRPLSHFSLINSPADLSPAWPLSTLNCCIHINLTTRTKTAKLKTLCATNTSMSSTASSAGSFYANRQPARSYARPKGLTVTRVAKSSRGRIQSTTLGRNATSARVTGAKHERTKTIQRHVLVT
jgi:hypothetical protein